MLKSEPETSITWQRLVWVGTSSGNTIFPCFLQAIFFTSVISSSIAYIKVKSNQLESHNNWPQCLIWNKVSQSPPPFFFIWDSLTTSASWGRFRRPECNDFTAKLAAGSGERTAWPQWPGFAVGPGGREVSHPQNERSSQIPSDSKMLKLQIKLTRSKIHIFKITCIQSAYFYFVNRKLHKYYLTIKMLGEHSFLYDNANWVLRHPQRKMMYPARWRRKIVQSKEDRVWNWQRSHK